MTDTDDWRESVKRMFGTSDNPGEALNTFAPARTNVASKEGQHVAAPVDDDKDMRAYTRDLFNRPE